MGRFMSPDWSDGPDSIPNAKLANPQSLNLYSYVYNNPLSRVDPDGHATWGDCNDGSGAQCLSGDYNGEANQQNGRTVYWNAANGNWDNNDPTKMNDGRINDLSGGQLLMAVPLERLVAPVVGPALAKVGEGIGSVFGKTAAKATTDALTVPAYANTPGGFVSWLRNLSRDGAQLTSSQVDAVVAQAKQLGVDVRLDPPHPGTP